MARVTSAQLQKQFGTYSRLAEREPVTITNHGRDSLVLLSVEDYQRLKSFDTREAFLASEATDDFLEALEKAEPPEWTAMYDHEMEG